MACKGSSSGMARDSEMAGGKTTSLRHAVVDGAIFLGKARIAVNILNAASIVILAHLLTPNDFGIAAVAAAVLSVAMSLTETSVQQALVVCRNPTRAHVDTAWTVSALRAVAMVVAFALLAVPLAEIYSDKRLVSVFIVAGMTGACMGLYNPLITLATRDMRFGPFALFQIIQKLAGIMVSIALALWLGNFWAIIIGNAVGSAAASLASYLFIAYRPRFSLAHIHEIWSFSGWMFLNQLCETLNWRFDQLAIGIVAPKAAMGHYAVADNLAVIPSREISGTLSGALFAGLANITGDPARMRSSYLRAQSTLAMITVPAAVGLALVAEPAVLVALGQEWANCAIFMQILALSYGIETFSIVFRPLAMAMAETKFLFVRQVIALCVRVPLIVIGLIFGGLVGAAIGRLASSAVVCLASCFFTRSLLGLPVSRQLRVHAPTIMALAVMVGVVMFADAHRPASFGSAPALQLVFLSMTGALAYAGALLLVWIAQGRPDGPVAEIRNIICRAVSDLRPRKRLPL